MMRIRDRCTVTMRNILAFDRRSRIATLFLHRSKSKNKYENHAGQLVGLIHKVILRRPSAPLLLRFLGMWPAQFANLSFAAAWLFLIFRRYVWDRNTQLTQYMHLLNMSLELACRHLAFPLGACRYAIGIIINGSNFDVLVMQEADA